MTVYYELTLDDLTSFTVMFLQLRISVLHPQKTAVKKDVQLNTPNSYIYIIYIPKSYTLVSIIFLLMVALTNIKVSSFYNI